MQVWYRSRAAIWKYCSSRTSPRMSTKSSSPANRLPLEVVEIIIAHLIYNKLSLLTCSLTCRSWYIATVPHIHHTLTAKLRPRREGGSRQCKSFSHAHCYGSLPGICQTMFSSCLTRTSNPGLPGYLGLTGHPQV